MMIRAVSTTIPTGFTDEDGNRSWIVLLACGHEAQVWGRLGLRPKKGTYTLCKACERRGTP